MKNLKRVLSLGLASVMLLGMMVMGASAATFSDAADIKNDVAVNMMASLNVINGKDDGSFDPNGTVTRGEMAKMITMIMFGGEEAVLTTSGTPRFTDVTNHWARKYIEYCAGKGIIAGMGDNTFAPDAKVTGTAAAKMALVALGYDAKVYKFEGDRDWEININNVANSKGVTLYKGLKALDPSQPITRDQAAQILYNALQAYVVEPTYTVTSNGIETEYNPGTDTLLVAKFDITPEEGKMTGVSYDKEKAIFTYTISGVTGNTDFAEDVTDLFGQEVKIIRTNDTDKKVLGIYASGDETVVTSTVGKVKDADGAKINVDGTKYEIAETVTLYKNADSAQKSESKGSTAVTTALKGAGASYDTLKLILNADGKVDTVTVINQVASKVTNKTASKITIQGLGTLELDEHDIESDLAKGDVVVYTLTVDNKADLPKARATVKAVDSIEGKVTGYNATKKTVTIDGTKYDVEGTPNLTENAITALKDIIGDEVTAYLVSGVVVALDKSTTTADTSYAMVTATNGNATSSSSLTTGRVRLLLSDGSSEEYNVYKEGLQADSGFVSGDLVKFSVRSDGTVKIVSKVADSADVAKDSTIWDDSTKKIANVGVAATGAVIYVNVSDDAKNPEWKVYNVRDLRTFKALDVKNDQNQSVATKVFHVTDDSGKVTVAAVDYKAAVYGTTADTLWGMVLSYDGKVGIGDTEYFQYTVWTNAGEVTVNLETQDTSKVDAGKLVQFDEASDKIYAANDFKAITGSSTVVAVNEYSESDRVLSYFTALEVSDGTYSGKGTPTTVAVSKDLEVLYVNVKDKKAGEDIGINEFNSENGFANAMIYVVDGIVEKVIIETSDKCSVDGNTTEGTIGGTAATEKVCEHKLTSNNDAKAATCGAAGTKETWTCSECSKTFIDNKGTTEATAENKVIPATGSHTYDDDSDMTCNVCGHDRTNG
ncbi:MAG: hypothetical protein HFF04_06245 [Oscillospiraceae bacterium]|nr:hypothetical protein [Oscillospiraceae bacterium]